MTTQTHKWLPSEPTFEMVNAGINVWLNQENPNKPINFVEIFKAMWEKATEVEQEPVAYRNFNQGEGGYEYPWLYVDADDLVGHTDAYIRNAEPLYTHPQPKREPLYDEIVLGIARTIPNLSGDDVAMIRFARELGV